MKFLSVISLIIVIAFSNGLTSTAQASGTPNEILYSQDFNSGSAEEWQLATGWIIVPSENGFALQGKGHEWVELNKGPWKDYYMQFRVNLQPQSGLHANIRKTGPSRYFIGLGQYYSYISRQDDENTFHDGLAKGVGIASGWHTIRISAVKDTLEVLSDGKKLMAYKDPNPLTAGGVAFENLTEIATLVDDVIVGISTPGETAAPAPISTPVKVITKPTSTVLPATIPAPNKLTWVYTGGPLGGMGYDVRMSPDNPDVMFVTDAKAGVFKSTDSGKTWTAANEGITTRTGETGELIPIFSLTISPTDPNLIWVGTKGLRGAFKSTDAGKTWKKMDSGIGYPSLTLRGFAIDPQDNNIVYAAGELSSWEWSGSDQPGAEFDIVKGVIFKTTNGGQSWKEIWKGNNLARYVLIDPRDSNVLYASTGIFDREAADSDFGTKKQGGEGILKSTDAGQTWRRINNGLGNLYVGSLFMHPTNPDILMAGTGSNTYNERPGIYISKDGGENWLNTFSHKEITAVEISLTDPNIAYAGNFGEFFRSEDGGMSWHQVSVTNEGWGPPGLLGGQPIDFQVDPRNARRLFANAYGGGNFLSEDGGQTWVEVSRGYTGSMVRDIVVDPTAPGHVYAVARSGFFESRDGGSSWQTPIRGFRLNDFHTIAMDPDNTAHILVELNCALRMAQSTDGGRTFEFTFNTSDHHGWRALAFAPSDPLIAYAGGTGFQSCGQMDTQYDGNGFLRSTDGGRTWTSANDASTGNTSVSQIAVHPNDPQIVYAATSKNGLLKTTDGGLNWPMIGKSTFPKTTILTAVEISPWDSNTVFVGKHHGGLWKSTNAGSDWTRSSSGLNPEASVTDIVFDPTQPQVMYIADLFSGVYRSQDGGKIWKPINKNLLNRAVNKLAITTDGLHLYAATEGNGVFRLDLNGMPPPSIPERVEESEQPTVIGEQTGAAIERQTAEAASTPIELPTAQQAADNTSSGETPKAANPLFPKCSALPAGIVIGVSLLSTLKKKRMLH